MKDFPPMIARDEALEKEARYYSDVKELYILDENGADTEILIGTQIAMRAAKDGKVVLASTVERAYKLTERSYKRAIAKEIGRTARIVARFNEATSFLA